jgi:phage-related protein
VAQIYNTGRTETYPVLRVRATSGTARLYQIENTLIGASVRTNYTLQAGEEVTLDTAQRTLESSYAGNIYGAILPGSNISSWCLMPGVNWVSFFADSDALAVSLVWQPKSWSADAGTAL